MKHLLPPFFLPPLPPPSFPCSLMEFRIHHPIASPLCLANSLLHNADQAQSYRKQCAQLKEMAQELINLLQALARVLCKGSGGLYKRPTQIIMEELQEFLLKALSLAKKCKKNGIIKRVVTVTSSNDFKRINAMLEIGIRDTTWLLNILSIGGGGGGGEGKESLHELPPIASLHPMLPFVWEHIALLRRGPDKEREVAGLHLTSIARDNGKIIVQEVGITPILKILSEGTINARVAAAKTLGYMASDPMVVKQMVMQGVAIPVLVKVIKNSPIKVQASIAWAIAEMVSSDRSTQNYFLQHGAISPLVSFLGFRTLEESSKSLNNVATTMHLLSTSASKPGAFNLRKHEESKRLYYKREESRETPIYRTEAKSLNSEDVVDKRIIYQEIPTNKVCKQQSRKPIEVHWNGEEKEHVVLQAELVTEAARALWKLAAGNVKTSKSIVETNALICFAKLMEKEIGPAQSNSLMAIMEIAAVAEQDAELRRAAFKMCSSAAKAVVDQLLRLAEEGKPELQGACIKAIGSLSRAFPARESRVIRALVSQLDGEEEIATEAVKALVKFACTDNYLHREHCKAMMEASVATHLSNLITSSKGRAIVSAVILMCFLVLHADEENQEALIEADALAALESINKSDAFLQDGAVQKLLPRAIKRLEMHQNL